VLLTLEKGSAVLYAIGDETDKRIARELGI